MAGKFRFVTKALFFTAAVAYPAMIFYFLVIRKMPLRTFSLFVMAFALVVFITFTSKKKVTKNLFHCFGIPSFYWPWGPCAL